MNLKEILGLIEHYDTNYEIRNKLVMRALGVAIQNGYEAGIRIDPNEPGWPVVYIELPTGQVSWHVPQHSKEWDGHTTEDKYERIRAFCK